MKRTNLLVLIAVLPLAGATAPAQEKIATTSTGIEIVWIPPGEFLMGSTEAEKKWALQHGAQPSQLALEGEKPQQVKIAQGFWMGRTPVTMGQFKQFVDATHYVTEAEKKGSAFGFPTVHVGRKVLPGPGRWMDGVNWKDPRLGVSPLPNHPVVCIAWSDAVAFCEWLTAKEAAARRLPASLVYRLPTEAEWEYACRGGRKGTKFWWGDNLESGQGRVNWEGDEDGFATIAPVDHFRARGRNGFGLADMAGNVSQWCLDGFDPAGAHAEPYKDNDRDHVRRGGSFVWPVACARCASRVNYGPIPIVAIGFRICCGAPR